MTIRAAIVNAPPPWEKLQEEIGYRFADEGMLRAAMTHRSLSALKNNQRLEFLGDRVLGLVVADMLYRAFPGEQEGELARRHAALVCGDAVAGVARVIGLGAFFLLSPSEDGGGGRGNLSNLEDSCEALIGAIYLDGGLEPGARFVEKYWRPLIDAALAPPKDAKTALQEWAQARGMGLPVYREIERSGPDHAPAFTIQVTTAEQSASSKAASKRAAEQAAAAILLRQLMEGR